MLENTIKNEDHTYKSKNEDPKSCKKKINNNLSKPQMARFPDCSLHTAIKESPLCEYMWEL